MGDIKIAALPLDILSGEPSENVARALDMIDKLPDDVDVAVLPELFTTGFIPDKEKMMALAEPGHGPTLAALREKAAMRGCAISGSIAAVDNGRLYNRGFIVTPDGNAAFYDKRHLFSVSSEAEIFTAGTGDMPVVGFRGWNISMIICYDLRFPVWSRNTSHRYDMLLVPANWPMSRGYAWTHLLIARAIENQAVVVGANRGGCDDYGDYDGLSQIFDACGMPIGQQCDGGIVMATTSTEQLEEARRRLPAHLDADSFLFAGDCAKV